MPIWAYIRNRLVVGLVQVIVVVVDVVRGNLGEGNDSLKWIRNVSDGVIG